MTKEEGRTYFESLCEEEQSLQESQTHLLNILDILSVLADPRSSDDLLTESLKKLPDLHRELINSSIRLRYDKYQTREAQLLEDTKTGRDVAAGVQNPKSISEYYSTFEHLNRDTLRYINLLKRLSVDLAKQVEVSDPSVTVFEMDKWVPSEKLQGILEQYCAPDTDIRGVDAQTKNYLDQIKMARAKFGLENKYSLKERLSTLTKELNHWRKEWDDIEMLMFGDDAHSMKKMIQKIDSLKSEINAPSESYPVDKEGDIVLE
ncbi:ASN_HP2_G0024070.mRNA.1.CDS.1 [Saccharomyces cerevisiae]|nr:BGN_3a_G0024790.mRNA.1.CDS.1 [Saccharomyces cerevisiae]CAI4516144.1 BGP_1a_G0024390.mRNA.1.CDS.1 [Saccharomyces cerevisiae]CAI5264292.1 ASN_HP2_G0024070.mRNA.1.CDS.1 [Saccharomyces cerevisiae]CAI5284080.1 BFH_HP2_G0024670.mRNA.1.CDS.1 [Saccharomyces cerevisiae]CAI6476051.1 ASN_HP2_G0024070.mRNA.1.CDS.1 [Saccharomyces cerevisiae]